MNNPQEEFYAKVLIVDDDFAIRLLARNALEQAGFQVAEVDNGQAAIASLETFIPDIILLDVLMPGMDGFTTCRELGKHPYGADIPVLMMTGLDDLESIQYAYQTGATDFITKPIDWLALQHRVRCICKVKQDKQRAQTDTDITVRSGSRCEHRPNAYH